jgi:putative oxidoreductase
MDWGILALRLVVGLYLFGHGSQKLFGWFGGNGMEGTRGMVGRLGFRPVGLWALGAALTETLGGLLLALGLLNPVGSVLVASSMLVAILGVHWSKGVWSANGGFELPLTNLAAAFALATTGPGAYSLDRVLHVALREPAIGLVLAVLVVLGVAAAFLSRSLAPGSRTGVA